MATANEELVLERKRHLERKLQLLSAVSLFNDKCSTVATIAPFRTPLNVSCTAAPKVKVLDGLPATDKQGFFSVPHLAVAGLKTENADITKSVDTFYARDDVKLLWGEIDKLEWKRNLAVKGQPGTGKSSAVWRKVLEMALNGDNILWVSLHRDGSVGAAVYFQGIYFFPFFITPEEIPVFLHIAHIPLDTVVLDGRSNQSTELVRRIEGWVIQTETGTKCRSITTASTKVEEQRAHQNDRVTYTVVHSWTIDEFYKALVQEEQLTSLYDTCAELFDEEYGMEGLCTDEDDDSDAPMDSISSAGGDSDQAGTTEHPCKKKKTQIPIEEILPLILSRYAYSGGSARWMFNYKKTRMDTLLNDYCNSLNNRAAMIRGEIGPTLEESTNYFFGSYKKNDGTTEYCLVSRRAVELMGKATEGAVYETLYAFADQLENQSFLGWIVEADFFSQVDKARLLSTAFSSFFGTPAKCRSFRPEAILPFEHTKNKNYVLNLNSTKIKQQTRTRIERRVTDIASKLVTTSPGHSVVGKPIARNQGGYDAFFVEFEEDMVIHLRFAQITIGESHSLKGEYFQMVVGFFEKAGYEVESVEIAFFLTARNSGSFTLTDIEGVEFLKDYLVFNSTQYWATTEDGVQASVAKYELKLSRKTHV